VDLGSLADDAVVSGASVDVVRQREATRRRRLWKTTFVLGLFGGYLWYRVLNAPISFGWPQFSAEQIQWMAPLALIVLLGGALILPIVMSGKSPHVRFQPSEIAVGFDDVVGLGVVRDEVVKTLNLFLAYQTFRDQMGGNPRKAILFEGPPGTGKTYMAKAMAREAGVPFLFVSSSAFQSM
jgi:cell division protease FtsH